MVCFPHDTGTICRTLVADDYKPYHTESESYDAEESQQQVLEPAEISSELSHWTLAVMDASVNDPLETIRLAPVLGFIAIASVDEDRRRLKFLSPVMGSLGNRPLIWGRWPEPYLNLLG